MTREVLHEKLGFIQDDIRRIMQVISDANQQLTIIWSKLEDIAIEEIKDAKRK